MIVRLTNSAVLTEEERCEVSEESHNFGEFLDMAMVSPTLPALVVLNITHRIFNSRNVHHVFTRMQLFTFF